ncbi:MAG: hypothetical protein NC918_04225 [Candidatus Omnitrophica bacterium]|nr:hypothetical protein [Candidatus Omnitrophota bacterium]
MVTYQDFLKLDLRVGKIIEVLPHPNADKLYLLKVDAKDKIIQLVAGIRPYYKEEELKDRLIVVVTNLEPKEIRGYVSEGMLLAASSTDKVCIISPDKEIEVGSKVK